MSRLRIVSAAHLDFLQAVEYYLAKSEVLATDFVECVDACYDAIAANPTSHPRFETILTEREIRRIRVSRFPYLIVYEMNLGEPVVLSIQHASRHPEYWKHHRTDDDEP